MGKTTVCLLICLVVLDSADVTFGELVGHWKLDEGTGTKIADSSGKGNNGTITGSPTWITGPKDKALEFHGMGAALGKADYITVPHSASLDIKGPTSIALWIRPDAEDPEGKGTTGGETAPMAKALSGASPSWSFQVRYGWGGAPQPYMAFTFNTTPRAWAFVGKKLPRGEWCHIAGTFDGTTLKCYLNGLQTDSTAMGPITSSPTPVLIGTDGWGCDWYGAIDDVRMYNTGLTADEIAQLCPPSRAAKNPNPADGAAGIQMGLLRWEAGYKGVMHEVYLGTSPDLGPANLIGPRSPVPMAFYTGTLQPGTTYYWRVDEIESDLTTVNKGNVWSFTTQALTAYLPSPKDGAGGSATATLTWQPGQLAAKHRVYFGGTLDAVTKGDASVDKGIQTATTFTPGPLDIGTTYYWRVDEIKADNTVVTGPVWSFTTCLPVDDFESYTDKEGQEVFSTWVDGLTTGLSGSVVGLATSANGTFGSTTIFHGGKQSMPMDYNNVPKPYYSEAERTFATAQDWTAGGTDTLVLFIYGKTGNWASPLYVALTDSVNKAALVVATNNSMLGATTWTQWTIPLSSFTGVNAAKIKKMVIGVGDRAATAPGGKGTIYVDDIWLVKGQK